MKNSNGITWAYLILIVSILGKYFYSWIFDGVIDYFMMAVIILSTIAFICGNRKDKKQKNNQ